MPAKRNSIEKSLGKKVVSSLKYLPIGASIHNRVNDRRTYKKLKENAKANNYSGKSNEELDDYTKGSNEMKRFFKRMLIDIYSTIGTITIGAYILAGTTFDVWTPKQYKDGIETFKKEFKETAIYNDKVRSTFDSELGKCATAKDSLEFYKVHGLDRYLFEEPSFDDKERVIKSIDSTLVK